MRRLLAAVAAVVVASHAAAAGAQAPAALVMFESPGCKWCLLWDEQVGGIYPKTDEARLLPLRRVRMGADLPPDLPEIAGVRVTPTFVAVVCGAEVGRILGYPGEDLFWGLLGEIVARIERDPPKC